MLIVFLVLQGCSSRRIQRVDSEAVVRSDLAFLEDGATSRENVLLELGHPSGRFEDDRILTFLLCLDDQGRLQVTRPRRGSEESEFMLWKQDMYNLVLVFAPTGLLERHRIIVSR